MYVSHRRQLINPTLNPAGIFSVCALKLLLLSMQSYCSKGNSKRSSFLVSKTAFDVDREQEPATAMENQNQDIIGASATLLVLSTVFVALRLLSRKLSKAGFWVSMRFTKFKDQADD